MPRSTCCASQGANSPSPLIGVPGIIVTPHMATFSRESMDRVALSVADSVDRRVEGERPAGLVNPEPERALMAITYDTRQDCDGAAL